MVNIKQNGRAIVTYGRSIIALMIAQSLGRRGIEIIGCDSVAMTVLSFSKFVKKNGLYTDPNKDEAAFIDDLVALVQKYKPPDGTDYVLIPTFNEGRIIARNKHRFDGLIIIAYPDSAAVEKVNPKDNFAHTAKELNIVAPHTWMPADENDLLSMIPDMGFPVFIKPADDVGGRGISKCGNAKELQHAYSKLEQRYKSQQILVQQACTGVDYCYCGLYDNGKRIVDMVYTNLRKFPVESGAGVVRETVPAEPFRETMDTLMTAIKWHGVAEVDFIWDGKDSTTPYIIEVNARFWAGLDHSIKSDVDFPYMLYKLCTEGKVLPADGAGKEADIGKKTKLPGLAGLAGIDGLFTDAIHFDELEDSWPDIMEKLKSSKFKDAFILFTETLQDSLTIKEALDSFKAMRTKIKYAESISYAQDDPFIGMGILFILSSLARDGTLPPEVKF